MGLVDNNFQMGTHMKADMFKVILMEKENIFGKMEFYLKVIFFKDKGKEKAF